jgi:type VII secretion-associated serine protease mycosin
VLTTAVAALLVAAAVIPAGAPGVAGAAPMAAAVVGNGGQARATALAQLAEIGVPAAWQGGQDQGQGVTVAVLDTGVDPEVPDLAGSVRTGPDYTLGINPAGYQPPRFHGTYIASLIAGHGSGPGDASGIIGVAPAAQILSVRVILDGQEPGFPVYNANQRYKNALARGIRYAVRHGAGVINMSLGSATGSRQLRAAIGSAIAHGVVVVASAGNGGAAAGRFSPYSYPASYTGVISVAAVGPDHRRAPFSDRNSSVVLAAPGVRIVGAFPGGYVAVNGTSPASAFVAGVAALIRSRYPRLTPDQVRQAMTRSAAHRPPDGYGPGVGFGEVDAAAAVALAGRLAARGTDPGLAPGAHFGPGPPGPVKVTSRDRPRVTAAEHAAAAGVLVFLAGLLAIAVLLRWAARRPPRRPPGAAGVTAGSGSRSRRW